MIEKKCICRNVGVCSLANNESIQTIIGDDIVELYCSECGEMAEEYVEVQEKKKPQGANKKYIAIVAGALLLVALGVSAYFFLPNKKLETKVDTPLVDTEKPTSNKPKDVRIESLTLNVSTLELMVDESEQLAFGVNPQGADTEQLQWVSRDVTVATVDGGVVTAIAEGTTMIVVGSEDKALAKCKVEVKKKVAAGDSAPKTTVNSINKIASGTWTGGNKNNKPHGANITFTFTSKTLIDKRDPKQRVARAGDYIIGEYVEGHLVHGRWYKKSGGFESIIIGQP